MRQAVIHLLRNHSMKDIILISRSYSMEFLKQPLEQQPEGSYCINYIRFNNQSSVAHIIQKKPLTDLPDDEIVEIGEILNSPSQFGSLSIDTEEEAITITEQALAKKNSEVRQKGFDESTTIVVADLDNDIARIIN